MTLLSQMDARRCSTAAGVLICNQKVLLIKHKKLQLWMPPGGHVEPDELPHIAAEREFFEETGVKVKTISALPLIANTKTEYLPVPFAVNLHWMNETNYQNRIQNKEVQDVKLFGCEQHYCFIYLMQLDGLSKARLKVNPEETDGVDWFLKNQISSLEMSQDIQDELQRAFKIFSSN